MLNSIDGRSVIVTGASKGIGKGIAKVFASKGARILVAARNLDPAEATVKEIRAAGGAASALAADVSNWADTQRIAAAAIRSSAESIFSVPMPGSFRPRSSTSSRPRHGTRCSAPISKGRSLRSRHVCRR